MKCLAILLKAVGNKAYTGKGGRVISISSRTELYFVKGRDPVGGTVWALLGIEVFSLSLVAGG